MILSEFTKKTERFVLDNSPALLTAVGVTGALTTAYLTGTASFKAARMIQDEQKRLDMHEKSHDLETREKFELIWKLYIPAVGVGSITVASIISANRIGTRRAAALAAAFSISEKAFDEYKEKVVEKLGEKKEVEVRDEIAQDRVNKNQPVDREIIVTGNGEVLCLDSLTGRYFQSTVENVKKAQNDTNYQILHDMFASLTDFYERLGLAQTPYSEEVGWNVDNMLEITFSTAMTDDNRPCIVLDYVVSPIRGYARLS